MTPEQLAALKAELERFLTHPLNEKHKVVRHGPRYLSVYYDNYNFIQFNEYDDAEHYYASAVLLQKLKDAMSTEGFITGAIRGCWGRWLGSGDEAEYQPFFEVEPDDTPELLSLLKTINNSEVWK